MYSLDTTVNQRKGCQTFEHCENYLDKSPINITRPTCVVEETNIFLSKEPHIISKKFNRGQFRPTELYPQIKHIACVKRVVSRREGINTTWKGGRCGDTIVTRFFLLDIEKA
jgi:hypothetical protein